MVTKKFVDELIKTINKELKDILTTQPNIQMLGIPQDQYRGIRDDLKTAFIPLRKSKYDAQDITEFLFARIPVNNPHFQFMDFITPVMNIKTESFQGVGTMITSVPYPVPETFVERCGWGHSSLLPHSLVVDQQLPQKTILKKNMITTKAVNAINADKKLRKRIPNNRSCNGPSNTSYKLVIEKDYPPGTFSIVPYKGHSVLIMKDTGSMFGILANHPIYLFKHYYEAFGGVADHLARFPEQGEEVGRFYMDSSLEHILPPLLSYLDGQGR